MKKITKSFSIFFSLSAITYTLLPSVAYAQCPVCTAAVVAGLGFSRWLGIDDTVSGVWIGGIILSSSLWFSNWISKKHPKWHTAFYMLLTTAFMYLIVFIPLQLAGITGHPFNKLWGVDKLVLGTLVGSAVFLLGLWADKKVRKIKRGQLFNFQKVVFPVALLLISSLGLWIITKP